jgi:hypothetical protein
METSEDRTSSRCAIGAFAMTSDSIQNSSKTFFRRPQYRVTGYTENVFNDHWLDILRASSNKLPQTFAIMSDSIYQNFFNDEWLDIPNTSLNNVAKKDGSKAVRSPPCSEFLFECHHKIPGWSAGQLEPQTLNQVSRWLRSNLGL